jgi:hypothetical protein
VHSPESLRSHPAWEAISQLSSELSVSSEQICGDAKLYELLKADSASDQLLFTSFAKIALRHGFNDLALKYIKLSLVDQSNILPEMFALLKRLAVAAFSSDSIDIPLECFELLDQHSAGSRTPSIILASLYFRKAHLLRLSESSRDEASLLYSKAYSLRRDVFELARIYRFKADLDQTTGRPANLNDIAETLDEFIEHSLIVFNLAGPSIDSKLYTMLRSALRLANRFSEYDLITETWLRKAVSKAEDLSAQNHHQASLDLMNSALYLHANLALDQRLAPVYKLISLASINLRKPKESEYAARLSLSTYSKSPDIGALNTAASSVQRDNVLILCFVSSMYMSMFDEWLLFFSRFKLDNILAVALDNGAYESLNVRKVPCILRNHYSYQQDFFWGTEFLVNKIQIISDLLQSGINVLCTGVDSIWLKNPFESIDVERHDIFAMGLTSSVANWSININTDFMYLRSSLGMISLLPRFLEISNRIVSDQMALNLLLSESGTVWAQSDDSSWTGTCSQHGLNFYLPVPSYCTRDRAIIDNTSCVYQPPSSLGYYGKLNAIRKLRSDFLT